VKKVNCVIRLLDAGDISGIAQAFEELGWDKPQSQYQRYLSEQDLGLRSVYVAYHDGQFAGYLTICWSSSYGPFRAEGIPEIVDLNVLPKLRRLGIGTQLMDKAERKIAKVSSIAGIGVGMDNDYGAAQRLYVLRGYVPDGRGLHHRGHPIKYGEVVTADDGLVLYFTKKLK
jgi:GNAT superfamily N-acetyltransferase